MTVFPDQFGRLSGFDVHERGLQLEHHTGRGERVDIEPDNLLVQFRGLIVAGIACAEPLEKLVAVVETQGNGFGEAVPGQLDVAVEGREPDNPRSGIALKVEELFSGDVAVSCQNSDSKALDIARSGF